jgi:formylglycine-generating enzyme required for sulfatase activity
VGNWTLLSGDDVIEFHFKPLNSTKSQKQKAVVERFTAPQQMDFLIRWFSAAFLRDQMRDEPGCIDSRKKEIKALTRKTANITAQELVDYLAKKENKGLKDLAGVPLLLQIMAILWKQSGVLPENREKLYSVTLDYLLYHRDKGRKIPTLLPAEEAKRLLAPVALWMLDKGHKMAPKVEMNEIMQAIIDIMALKYRNYSSEQVCRYFVDRAVVLRDLDTGYEFSHKTFQEYLAAMQLLKSVPIEADRLKNLVKEVGNQWWAESLLFFIAQVDDAGFNSFMEAFFNSAKSDFLKEGELTFLKTMIRYARLQPVTVFRKKLLDPSPSFEASIVRNRQRYLLECLITIGSKQAVEAAQEFKQQYPDVDLEILRKADEVVLITFDSSAVTVFPAYQKESSMVGSDNLQQQQAVFQSTIEPGVQYILIKGGNYLYSVFGEETLVKDFYIAKYQVTNRLYRRFINYLQSDETDIARQLPVARFREKLFLMAQQIEGYSDYLDSEPELVSLFRSRRDDDRRFKEDDQPVVAITWYAARAYCLWLSLLEGGKDDRYRLPIETEWEWAAGGTHDDVAQKVRPYPWPEAKGDPSSRLANYGETVGTTTPVGSYPEGATPEGVYDMAGNVWEWMDNEYKENTSARALRGGSWFVNPGVLRCSARGYYDPADSDGVIGFRVVRSSPLPEILIF